MKTCIIAIDIGSAGAVVAGVDGEIYVDKMPDTRGDLIELFRSRLEGCDEAVAYIEKVVSYIPQASPSAMFNYGCNAERPFAILQTLGVKIVEIRPQEWQKELSLGKSERLAVPNPPKGLKGKAKKEWQEVNAFEIKTINDYNAKKKREWKSKLKDRAQQRFPNIKVTLANCDALLLYEVATLKETREGN